MTLNTVEVEEAIARLESSVAGFRRDDEGHIRTGLSPDDITLVCKVARAVAEKAAPAEKYLTKVK